MIKEKDCDKMFENFKYKLMSDKSYSFNINKIEKAYDFAKNCHKNQKRLNGDDYLIHPLEVAKIVFENNLGENSIICALLHDVVEDCNISLKIIEKEFSKEISGLVQGLTKISQKSKDKKTIDEENFKKVLLVSLKDIRVLVIKICDIYHNLLTISNMSEEKIQKKTKFIMEYIIPIAQKIGIYNLKWKLEDICLKYQHKNMYYYLKEKIDMTLKEREETLKKVILQVRSILEKEASLKDILVNGRIKNFYSIYKKIKDKSKSLDDIDDMYAIRIIVPKINDCYRFFGIIQEKFKTMGDVKDYIANPKLNGYQSLHTIIFCKEIQKRVEIQIRTFEMHNLAEFGVAAHWKYKKLDNDNFFEKKISWLREILEFEKENEGEKLELHKLLKADFFEEEIITFTPKNKLITLSENSTALDFAYYLHTDIGNCAKSCKINGSNFPLDTILKNNDIVEIIVSKKKTVSHNWLNFVNMNKSKFKIRKELNLLKKNSKNTVKNNDVLNSTQNYKELINQLVQIDDYKKNRDAKCCVFEKNDNLIGVIRKDGVLVIHNASCINAKLNENRKVNLDWKKGIKRDVELKIYLKDKIGVFLELLNIVNSFNLHIKDIKGNISKKGSGYIRIIISGGTHVEQLVQKIKKLDFVNSIYQSKISNFKLF